MKDHISVVKVAAQNPPHCNKALAKLKLNESNCYYLTIRLVVIAYNGDESYLPKPGKIRNGNK